MKDILKKCWMCFTSVGFFFMSFCWLASSAFLVFWLKRSSIVPYSGENVFCCSEFSLMLRQMFFLAGINRNNISGNWSWKEKESQTFNTLWRGTLQWFGVHFHLIWTPLVRHWHPRFGCTVMLSFVPCIMCNQKSITYMKCASLL